MLTSPFVVKVRSVTRKLGINRLIGSFLQRGGYEDKFSQAFRKTIRSGDVVSDVGANVGLYTPRFLSDAGPEGKVVAFERIAACFQELRERLSQEQRVVLKNIAMGNSDCVMSMIIESDPLAATHRLAVAGSAPAGESVSVEVRSAAFVVKEEPSLFRASSRSTCKGTKVPYSRAWSHCSSIPACTASASRCTSTCLNGAARPGFRRRCEPSSRAWGSTSGGPTPRTFWRFGEQPCEG